MNEELKEALKTIKNECEKHERCDGCPFNERKYNYSYCHLMFNMTPFQWELD